MTLLQLFCMWEVGCDGPQLDLGMMQTCGRCLYHGVILLVPRWTWCAVERLSRLLLWVVGLSSVVVAGLLSSSRWGCPGGSIDLLRPPMFFIQLVWYWVCLPIKTKDRVMYGYTPFKGMLSVWWLVS